MLPDGSHLHRRRSVGTDHASVALRLGLEVDAAELHIGPDRRGQHAALTGQQESVAVVHSYAGELSAQANARSIRFGRPESTVPALVLLIEPVAHLLALLACVDQ